MTIATKHVAMIGEILKKNSIPFRRCSISPGVISRPSCFSPALICFCTMASLSRCGVTTTLATTVQPSTRRTGITHAGFLAIDSNVLPGEKKTPTILESNPGSRPGASCAVASMVHPPFGASRSALLLLLRFRLLEREPTRLEERALRALEIRERLVVVEHGLDL